jgi:hypothetical protein
MLPSKLVINSSMTLTVVGTLRILVQLLMASTDLVQFCLRVQLAEFF